jgi:hypothetical protein
MALVTRVMVVLGPDPALRSLQKRPRAPIGAMANDLAPSGRCLDSRYPRRWDALADVVIDDLQPLEDGLVEHAPRDRRRPSVGLAGISQKLQRLL